MTEELELHTTDELIQELLSRSTFIGVIIYAADEHRSDEQIHDDFRLYSTTDEEGTLKILQHGVHVLNRTAEEN